MDDYFMHQDQQWIDITGFVPYTGAAHDVDLGTHSILATGAQISFDKFSWSGGLFVDPNNGYIGIANGAPDELLTIGGYQSNTGKIKLVDAVNGVYGLIGIASDDGYMYIDPTNGGLPYVGIGNGYPTSLLHVFGGARTEGDLTVNSSLYVNGDASLYDVRSPSGRFNINPEGGQCVVGSADVSLPYAFGVHVGTNANFQMRTGAYVWGDGVLIQTSDDTDNYSVPCEYGASMFSWNIGYTYALMYDETGTLRQRNTNWAISDDGVASFSAMYLNGNTTYQAGANLILDTSTGSKIGTATNQKLAFWNATPIVQPTTSTGSSSFTANSGTAINNASTFDGYTLQKVVKALRNTGILA